MSKLGNLEKYIQAIREMIEQVPKVERQIRNKYNKIVKNGLENMAETAVGEFYEYTPDSYHRRQESLLHAYKVVATDKEWSIDFDPRYMKDYEHHQDNEIIFHNAFELGYHGGSWGTDKNGETVTEPYYRGPGGEYGWKYWLYPAEQDSVSPLQKILDQDPQGFIDDTAQAGIDEFDKRLTPYMNKIMKLYNKIYK